MTYAQGLAVEALAQLDALYEPMRDPAAPYWPAVWALRWAYRSQGLPWRGGGSKPQERDLTEAVAAGWLVRRRARTKTIGVRLTPAGMAEAWRLTGVHPWAHVIVLDELLRRARPRTWIAEVEFSGGRGWGDGRTDELQIVAHCHRPALSTALVEANCTMRGNVAYRTTGRSRPEVPAGACIDLDAPEADPEALALYTQTYAESIAWLDGQRIQALNLVGEIGRIPLAPDELVADRDDDDEPHEDEEWGPP